MEPELIRQLKKLLLAAKQVAINTLKEDNKYCLNFDDDEPNIELGLLLPTTIPKEDILSSLGRVNFKAEIEEQIFGNSGALINQKKSFKIDVPIISIYDQHLENEKEIAKNKEPKNIAVKEKMRYSLEAIPEESIYLVDEENGITNYICLRTYNDLADFKKSNYMLPDDDNLENWRVKGEILERLLPPIESLGENPPILQTIEYYFNLKISFDTEEGDDLERFFQLIEGLEDYHFQLKAVLDQPYQALDACLGTDTDSWINDYITEYVCVEFESPLCNAIAASINENRFARELIDENLILETCDYYYDLEQIEKE